MKDTIYSYIGKGASDNIGYFINNTTGEVLPRFLSSDKAIKSK